MRRPRAQSDFRFGNGYVARWPKCGTLPEMVHANHELLERAAVEALGHVGLAGKDLAAFTVGLGNRVAELRLGGVAGRLAVRIVIGPAILEGVRDGILAVGAFNTGLNVGARANAFAMWATNNCNAY